MSEIEKMYENVRVYDFRYDCNVSFADGDFGCITNCSKGEVKDYCTDKKYFKDAKVIKIKHLYPPFTAEKQIELIKWFVHSRHFSPIRFNIQWVIDDIASHINFLWGKLTEEEKQQIKEILE